MFISLISIKYYLEIVGALYVFNNFIISYEKIRVFFTSGISSPSDVTDAKYRHH